MLPKRPIALGLSALSVVTGAAAFVAPAAHAERCGPLSGCTDPEPDPDPTPPNFKPTASISTNLTQAHRGQAVHVTGSANDVEDGTPGFAYSIDHGPYSHSGETGFDVSFTTLGDHQVSIKATDSGGKESDVKIATIKVVNRTPTIAIDGPHQLLTGETGTFTATASDPDGDPVTVVWGSKTCNEIVNGEGTGPTKQLTAPTYPTDTLPICAIATDGLPGGYSAKQQFYVKVVNRKPIAAVTFGPAKPVAGEVVTFDSTGSKDDDGTIASRAWDTNGDGAFDDGTGVTAQRAYDAAGTYKASVKVVDDRGDATVKDVSVVVAAKPTTGGGTGTGGGAQQQQEQTQQQQQTQQQTPAQQQQQQQQVPAQQGVLDQVAKGAAANASALKVKLSKRGKVKAFKLSGATGTITVACAGKGCAFKTRTTTNANLKGLFRKALKKGATVTVTTGDGTAVAKRTFTVAVKKAGKTKVAIA